MNGTQLTKFPSATCHGFRHLGLNDTVFYKTFGDKKVAFQSECPPKGKDFVLAFKKLDITYKTNFVYSYMLALLFIYITAGFGVFIVATPEICMNCWYVTPCGLVVCLIDMLKKMKNRGEKRNNE